jgi:hypothetical protein
VALGSSFTAGFQAGALFDAGQQTSLGKILATQFACAGGGTFNQPNINTTYGYNIFFKPNPAGNIVLGRMLLQGTPPKPSPYKYAPLPDADAVKALPNPSTNPSFMYTGSAGAVPSNQLNNFSVQAVYIGQAMIAETGDWSKAGVDPRFNPFYGRFASNPGASHMLGDAIGSLTNGGTFFMLWLGMDDVLLHALNGGDSTLAPLTPLNFVSPSNPGFTILYNNAINGLLANPTLEGVVANYPDIFTLPHFTLVPYNPVPLDASTATVVNNAYAGYNQILEALKGPPFNYPAATVDARKISFAAGNNAFVVVDKTVKDYGDEFDALQGAGAITAEQRAALVPYEQVRMTTAADVVPFATAGVLGTLADPNNPLSIRGVAVPLTDQYVITPTEKQIINNRLAAFNAVVKAAADANTSRVAFADVNKAMKDLLAAGILFQNGVGIQPTLAPPTGIYSEDGVHPNSRGYAFIANVFIDAINTKFGSTIPHAKVSDYTITGLPINP